MWDGYGAHADFRAFGWDQKRKFVYCLVLHRTRKSKARGASVPARFSAALDFSRVSQGGFTSETGSNALLAAAP